MTTTRGITRYGMQFPAGIGELDIELWCYALDPRPENTGGRLSRWDHFRNAVDMLWNNPESTRRVIWNEWTERMLKGMIYNRYVGLAGCGSSGKSDSAAVFALVEWLSCPTETLILITSTTIDGARKRVWKSITELWNSIEAQFERAGKTLPGKMVQSRARIVGMDINGTWNEALGLTIVAADQSSESEAAKKLKGLKAPAEGKGKLRLIADELPDLGFSVLVAGIGNLNTNPDFKMIGMGNPTMKLDPFGQFCEPKAGWRSVNASCMEWETRFGVCLRFDATQSPRIQTPEFETVNPAGTSMHSKYNWMSSQDAIDQAREFYGESSREYWAQFKGMWCPDGQGNMVWSEAELDNAMSTDQPQWDMPPTPVAGLDPGFTTGGDRSVAVFGLAGRVRGRKHVHITGYELINEGIDQEKMESGDEMDAMSFTVIQDFKNKCRQKGVLPQRAGVDATGGGVVFIQWMAREWSPAVRKINFGGAPVERVSMFGRNEEDYADRVSQLWCQPKPLVRDKQVSGIPKEVVFELCQRKLADRPSRGKMQVEAKREMKKRTGRSPDLADAFVIFIETCILNGLLDFEEIKAMAKRENKLWKEGIHLPNGQHFRIATPAPKPLSYR